MAERVHGWLIGDGGFQIDPIHGADFADVIVRCIADSDARGRAFDAGGPDVRAQREILELAFAARGERGAVAPATGTHHLTDCFAELARAIRQS
jgi:nucleoside-diphosphate-sugar epimerase